MVSSSLFSTLFAASILLLSSSPIVVNAQNVINIDAPQPGGSITSKTVVSITYTVIGSQAANPALNASKTYPQSLSVNFVWTENANSTNSLSFGIASGLTTDEYPGGLQNIQSTTYWNAPNCHFFSRYPPTTYDFSLVFTPLYPSVDSFVGTVESPITVPLAVIVNNSTFPQC